MKMVLHSIDVHSSSSNFVIARGMHFRYVCRATEEKRLHGCWCCLLCSPLVYVIASTSCRFHYHLRLEVPTIILTYAYYKYMCVTNFRAHTSVLVPVPEPALSLHFYHCLLVCLHANNNNLETGPRLINMTDFRSSLASTPPGAILTSFARSAEVRVECWVGFGCGYPMVSTRAITMPTF